MIKSDRIVTSLNTKNLNGEYCRYDIGASAKNIYYNHNHQMISAERILNNIKEGCLKESDLSFELRNPLTIIQNDSNIIYNGTESKTIDLSKFLTKESKWNNMDIDTSSLQYESYYWVGANPVKEISYNGAEGGWVETDRIPVSGSNAYWYPKYSGAVTYRPTSVCKITLPKGTYLINYSVQVPNEYDSTFSNSNFTGNTGILKSSQVAFAEDGIERVTPGLISATLCPDDDFKKIQKHTYREYPSDDFSLSKDYYVPGIARTAPRTQGSLISAAYTGHSMIYQVTSLQAVLHLLVTHYNTPTDKIKRGEGYSVDSNGNKRILCPVNGWIQIMSLSSMN